MATLGVREARPAQQLVSGIEGSHNFYMLGTPPQRGWQPNDGRTPSLQTDIMSIYRTLLFELVRFKRSASAMDDDDDDEPRSGVPRNVNVVSALFTRLAWLRTGALYVHKPAAPPDLVWAAWADQKKRTLIEVYAKVKLTDPRYKVMYAYPIQALMLFSSLCTNWWVGAAAITIVEMLAVRFYGAHGSLMFDPTAYLLALRNMTIYVMDAFYEKGNRASLYNSWLDPEKDTVYTLISVALAGLWKQGAPPLARPYPARTPPCHAEARARTHSLHHPHAGRITGEEYAYFLNDVTVKGLIFEINKVVDILGGFKMGELVKWCERRRPRSCARPPPCSCMCAPQVAARQEQAAMGLWEARLCDARRAGRQPQRA